MVWAYGKMDEYRMARKGVNGESKWRAGTRETEVRLDRCVKLALGNRGMAVEATRNIGKSGEPWYI